MLTRAKNDTELVVISKPNFVTTKIKIVGESPYVMNKMSSANRRAMMEKQESGERSKKGKKREPKDFDAVYKGAMHISKEGWYGIPCSALRAALIRACSVSGYQMTRAKLSIFVEPDGIDADDGQPLVRLYGEPTRRDMAVKLADGSSDIIARPFFDVWYAEPTLSWDGDQFSASDVINLLSRAGRQVGIGAGRHFSKESTGMGWGVFRVRSVTTGVTNEYQVGIVSA